jgi:hypothetical protein
VGELDALLAAAQLNPRTKGCAGDGASARVTCPKIEAELARARERDRLQAAVDRASEQLGAGPAKVANSDAKALARFMAAIGFDVTPERLNDLLVLLAVLMVECGGGLSLAIGMALSAPAAAEPNTQAESSDQPPNAHRNARTLARTPPSNHPTASERSPECPRAPTARPASGIVEWLAEKGGKTHTTQRALARALGRSPTAVHDELHRLAASGLLTMMPSARGTALSLASVARPN